MQDDLQAMLWIVATAMTLGPLDEGGSDAPSLTWSHSKGSEWCWARNAVGSVEVLNDHFLSEMSV